ncbi:dephospho-CoA kinase [Salinimicrobium marinum]|uniref:Dephospho-CoA kinase n=1 Tax=Salinimicrobium marinum TaxID=680283 RepID=A0A918SFX5_9FLAO|nr:dephospho-CoA kinase [Salinimicrobium marinum]GHA37138.1 dephospho-CoA kinase [Salinimicrobium marinum]
MKVVGLTGGIGSGKTTVANFFAELGVPVYIADVEAKKLQNESEIIKEQITALFGPEAYKNGILDRKFVSGKVFNDPEKLEALNNIVHPQVALHFDRWKEHQHSEYVLYEAAILFEKGGYRKCDYTILVVADHEAKIDRLKKRDKSEISEIKARMDTQWPDEKKLNLADFVIENRDLADTRREVVRIHQILLKTS